MTGLNQLRLSLDVRENKVNDVDSMIFEFHFTKAGNISFITRDEFRMHTHSRKRRYFTSVHWLASDIIEQTEKFGIYRDFGVRVILDALFRWYNQATKSKEECNYYSYDVPETQEDK